MYFSLLRCFTATKDVSFVAVVHCNIGISFVTVVHCDEGIFPSSRWSTATKELSFIAEAHRDMIDLKEGHAYDVQTFGYTPLKEGCQTCTLGRIDTLRSQALTLDH